MKSLISNLIAVTSGLGLVYLIGPSTLGALFLGVLGVALIAGEMDA